MKPPKYAKIGISEMRLKSKSKEYYRDAGHWSIGFELKDGKFYTKTHPCNKNLKGLEIIEITEQEWREGNRGYI